MKKKALVIIPILIVVVIGAAVAMRGRRAPEKRTPLSQSPPRSLTPSQPQTPVAPAHSPHSQTSTEASATERVPAHFKSPPSKESLRPTLAPEQFTGPTREAYRAVREIPQTIAQLPCYCYCDEGFGHKSLYSCFEDDHGAHCAVCVN